MFQANNGIPLGLWITIFSLVIAGISGSVNVIQFLLGQRDKRRRYLSERVYEPLLNEIYAVAREKVLGKITAKQWIEKSDAVVGALLELDDPALYQRIDEFFLKVREFEMTLDMRKKEQSLSEGGILLGVQSQILEELQVDIRDLGNEITAKIKKKLKI